MGGRERERGREGGRQRRRETAERERGEGGRVRKERVIVFPRLSVAATL